MVTLAPLGTPFRITSPAESSYKAADDIAELP